MSTAPVPIRGCYSEQCPKCGSPSPCVDHDEVDIRVGTQTGNHEFFCPTHGHFAFVDNTPAGDFSTPRRIECFFRDEATTELPSVEESR